MNKLSAEQREERDKLIKQAKKARGKSYDAELAYARYLRELNQKRLYKDHGSWNRFCEEQLGESGSRGRHRIKLADAHDELEGAGMEPLKVMGHVEALYSIVGSGQLPEVVRRAREIAKDEGKPLVDRHLKAAKDETLLGSLPPPADHGHDAPEGLSVVVPHSVAKESDGCICLPSGVVESWEATHADLLDASASTVPIGRTDLDPIADLVWPVLAPSPSSPPTTWAPDSGPFTATLFPDRIGQTTVRDPHLKREDVGHDGRPDGCARTVLVAPGVDLFHDDVPDGVVNAVMKAIDANPERRYVLRTSNAHRAAATECPTNAVIVVHATDAREAEEASAIAKDTEGIVWGLLLRDLEEQVSESTLAPFEWALVRGERTSQEAFSSVVSAMRGRTDPHVGPEVRARLSGFPALPGLDLSPPVERPSAAIHTLGRAGNGAALPPAA